MGGVVGKPTTTVYGVNQIIRERPVLESTTAELRGKTYRLVERLGSYGYRSVVPVAEVCGSPQAAIVKARGAAAIDLERAQRGVREALLALDALDALEATLAVQVTA